MTIDIPDREQCNKSNGLTLSEARAYRCEGLWSLDGPADIAYYQHNQHIGWAGWKWTTYSSMTWFPGQYMLQLQGPALPIHVCGCGECKAVDDYRCGIMSAAAAAKALDRWIARQDAVEVILQWVRPVTLELHIVPSSCTMNMDLLDRITDLELDLCQFGRVRVHYSPQSMVPAGAATIWEKA